VWWRLRLNFVDNSCFQKRFVVCINNWILMRNVIFYSFQQSWSLALALVSKRTGLGFEDYWPWPWLWPRTCCPRTRPCYQAWLSIINAIMHRISTWYIRNTKKKEKEKTEKTKEASILDRYLSGKWIYNYLMWQTILNGYSDRIRFLCDAVNRGANSTGCFNKK